MITQIKTERVFSPSELQKQFYLTEKDHLFIANTREKVANAVHGKAAPFIVITGPCSIHDEHSALEYADRLAKLQSNLGNDILLIMRVYLEKPRTTTGWKGFLYDPFLDGSNQIHEGLYRSRKLVTSIIKKGVPIATELLDPNFVTYFDDCITWGAIGARTSESQIHRQMVSGLKFPVGFKNSTDGNVEIAFNGMISSDYPHAFLNMDSNGSTELKQTSGNPNTHIVLRGGRTPNYDEASVWEVENIATEIGTNTRLLIDCSHANSGYNFRKQSAVFQSVQTQRVLGNSTIFGVMLESHLKEGKQAVSDSLEYGKSITDACIGWEETERIIGSLL